jgi:carbamoyl-phosphate synthase/aspartate carbamoyltransferase/dihydroorotase
LTITMVGDLKHGRTVHSLAKLLTLYDGVQFRFVSPRGLGMPEEIKLAILEKGLKYTEVLTIEEAIIDTDVLYVTRIQKERFNTSEEYTEACSNYVVNAKTLYGTKETLRILHPLPRVNEIAPEVDIDQKRAAYFRQAENGLYVRMALLTMVLGRCSSKITLRHN